MNICLCSCLSINLSIHQSIYLYICPYICLSVINTRKGNALPSHWGLEAQTARTEARWAASAARPGRRASAGGPVPSPAISSGLARQSRSLVGLKVWPDRSYPTTAKDAYARVESGLSVFAVRLHSRALFFTLLFYLQFLHRYTKININY